MPIGVLSSYISVYLKSPAKPSFRLKENKTLQKKAKGVGDTYFSTFFLALEPLPSNLEVSL